MINHIGETVIATNGQKLTLIAWHNKNDIDAQFEDGYIKYKIKYHNFKRGNVKNPNLLAHLKNNKIGEVGYSTKGQKMTIIGWNTSKDITVQFEDGTIVEHKTYIDFKSGKIKNPNYFKSIHLGETLIAKNGQKMTIIEYKGCSDITVQFEDGTIVKHVKYGMFKSRDVKNPNYGYDKMHIGKTSMSVLGIKMTIVGYRNCRDIDVQYQDGNISEHKYCYNFNKGVVSHPKIILKYGKYYAKDYFGFKLKEFSRTENAIYFYAKKGEMELIATLPEILKIKDEVIL